MIRLLQVIRMEQCLCHISYKALLANYFLRAIMQRIYSGVFSPNLKSTVVYLEETIRKPMVLSLITGLK